ncbi:hypothetical protein [Lactococcus fujiensis]|uniref:hypothetical protein n=1 Tax=Lactococcus fujiensis TaxID=610251 RepID=UPI0006D14695|nr:hypothetical protein [Lactococcus fujiensis]
MKLRIIGVVICLSVSLFNLSSCSQTKSIQKDTTTTSNTYDPFNKSGDYLQSQMSYLKKEFGNSTLWELEGSPFGSSTNNNYNLYLKLSKVEPTTTQKFEEIDQKMSPLLKKMLSIMKQNGIKKSPK